MLCEEADNEDFWEVFCKVTRPCGNHQVATLVVDGQHITDNHEKVQLLLDKFFPISQSSSPSSSHHVAVASRVREAL